MSLRTEAFLRRLRHERFVADLAAEATADLRARQATATTLPPARRRPSEWRTVACRMCRREYGLPTSPTARPATERGWYRLSGYCDVRCWAEEHGETY